MREAHEIHQKSKDGEILWVFTTPRVLGGVLQITRHSKDVIVLSLKQAMTGASSTKTRGNNYKERFG